MAKKAAVAQEPVMTVDQIVALMSEKSSQSFVVDESHVASALEAAESMGGRPIPHKAILDTIDTCNTLAEYGRAGLATGINNLRCAQIIMDINEFNRITLNTGEESRMTLEALTGLCAVPVELEDGFI